MTIAFTFGFLNLVIAMIVWGPCNSGKSLTFVTKCSVFGIDPVPCGASGILEVGKVMGLEKFI